MWDPSKYLPSATMPMLWVTGTNDFALPAGLAAEIVSPAEEDRARCA